LGCTMRDHLKSNLVIIRHIKMVTTWKRAGFVVKNLSLVWHNKLKLPTRMQF